MVLYTEWRNTCYPSYLDAVVNATGDQLALGDGEASDAALMAGQSLRTRSQFRVPDLLGGEEIGREGEEMRKKVDQT